VAGVSVGPSDVHSFTCGHADLYVDRLLANILWYWHKVILADPR
jgi:hypothetical protein